MRIKPWIHIAAAGLMIALPLAAAGQDDDAKDVRKKVVVVRDGEQVEVIGDNDGTRRFFVAGGGGYLGISPVGLTDELRAHFGVPQDSGVMVGKVFDDAPAAKAGLRVGDVITQVDGQKVESTFDVSRALRGKKKGEQVRVDFIRDRAAQHAFVTVEERKGGSSWTFQLPAIPPIELDAEALRSMESARALSLSADGKTRVFSIGADCNELQSRIKELEQRLKELEKRLK
ncbi:MAG TPA: PDZ domain-containing protein [Thermoanaerobaculia bacterium]|nr:PDZ domain-containing protein [Thermoanaerobaculia bacterium]